MEEEPTALTKILILFSNKVQKNTTCKEETDTKAYVSAETEKPVETVFFHLVPNMLKGSIHIVQEDPEDTSKVIGSTEEDTASEQKLLHFPSD